MFLDITATSGKRDTIVDLARRTADDVFVPFTIGGGIRSVDDAQGVLDAGADKVSVNSAAVARPELIDKGNVLPVWLQRSGYRAPQVGKFMNGYSETVGNPAEVGPGWNDWQTLFSRVGPLLRLLPLEQRPNGPFRQAQPRLRHPRPGAQGGADRGASNAGAPASNTTYWFEYVLLG